MKPLVRLGLPLVVTVGLLVAVGRAIDGPQFGARLLDVQPLGVVVASAAVPLQVALAARRWQAANASLGIALDTREAFAETGLATLLNQLLPSGVAGEVARIWRQRHPQRATSDVVAAALTDRGLGFATFVAALTLSLIAWPWLHPGTPPLLPIGAALALTVGGAMLLAVPSAVPAVGPVIHAIRRATTDRRTTTVLVSASVAFLAAILAQALVCAWALGLPGGLGLLGLLPLYLLSMLVPLSVGGWGPKEVAAVSLFPLLGWSAADAAAFSTVFGLTTLLGAAVFAPVALFRRRTP